MKARPCCRLPFLGLALFATFVVLPAWANPPAAPDVPAVHPAPTPASDAPTPAKPLPTTDAQPSELSDQETYELIKVFVDSLDQIERNYVQPIDRRELIEAAITGMLGKLDPYSSYIRPQDVERFRSVVESQFGGIGIQLTIEAGQLKIVSPLVGTPAYRAGLLAGDTILEIDGKPIKGIALDEAVRRLKGPVGSKLAVTVLHEAGGERKTVELTREVVHVETVLGDRRRDDDRWDYMYDRQKRIGYIRLTSFGRDSTRDLRAALEQLKKENMRALILDLRFNSGGLLTSAIETCDLFVDHGRIVSTQGRNTKQRIWNAKPEDTYSGFPMAVLVNRYSASASEIVSACLQDHKRAVVIGQRTWGKGSVQNVIDLEGGKSVLKLTTASYLRPNGKNIHRFPDAKETDDWGVRPDENYEVALGAEELRKLMDDRRHKDIVRPHKSSAKSPEESRGDLPPAGTSEKPKANGPEPAKSSGVSTAPGKSPIVAPAGQPAAAPQPTDKKTLQSEPAVAPSVPPAASAEEPFVDRQLERAIEYLNVEMARAG